MARVDSKIVKSFLLNLQNKLCSDLQELDGGADFVEDAWQREGGGGGMTRCIDQGALFERGGVNFSHVRGENMPASSTATRPELAGRSFDAMGVSLVLHPHNPMIPTTHMNVRFFIAQKAGAEPVWWFGGGFDLTPYYAFREDAVHWHRTAQAACAPFGADYYPRYKAWCDKYFYLKHRNETRGIGGLFFDDLNDQNFEHSFGLMRSIGEHFLPAYVPIVEKRRDLPFNEQERAFQLYRRGRYVEFNLLFDRGTLFGIQTGGRTESILMSMPPLVRWQYNFQAQAGSREAELTETFLKPTDWI